MSNDYTVYVGTMGQGLWRGLNGGEKWQRLGWTLQEKPFNLEAQTRAVALDPRNPAIIFAGDEEGLFHSRNGGSHWTKVPGPLDGKSVWSLAIDPVNPEVMFAGTRPPELYRSKDAGTTWQRCPVEIRQTSTIGLNRILHIRIDPLDHRKVWFGVEEDGVYRSLDGGETWAHVRGGRPDQFTLEREDAHCVTVLAGVSLKKKNGRLSFVRSNGTTLVVTRPNDILVSDDSGESFQHFLSGRDDMPTPYLRTLVAKPDDPLTLYLGISDAAIGDSGSIMRTRNGGESWERCELPVEPNSGIFTIAVNAGNPERVWAASLMGQMFRSEDAGESWEKVRRELTEIRALAFTP